MRNLLSNAAKYSGAGSTVEVSLEDTEGEVLIRVRDNGPGIAEDDADRLFGLYYRSAQQATTAPGAGIGLFVCRELVAAMGGRIWAESRPEGGSEFGFSIPAYVDELDFASTDDTVHVFDRGPTIGARIRRWRAAGHARLEPGAGHRLTPLRRPSDRLEPAVKCRSAGGWSTIRNPRSEAARSATQRTTSMT